MADLVTGARVAVDIVLDCPQETLWERLVDVARIGEWSPECHTATWLSTAGAVEGARFEARSRIGSEFETHVICVVTEADRPSVFGWDVLSASGDSRVSTGWRYQLTAVGDRTLVRQSFTHGPGPSGLRKAVAADPERGPSIVAGRLGQIRRNMIATLTAMAAAPDASFEPAGRDLAQPLDH